MKKINVNVRALKTVFPIGIYGGHTVLSSRDHIMNVLSWGLDTLVANPDKLDIAKQYGFKIIANVPKKGNEIDEDVLHKYRGHEALLAWYIVDEPDIWEVEGRIDYNRLIKEFGTKPLNEKLLKRVEGIAGELHPLLKRGIFFSPNAKRI